MKKLWYLGISLVLALTMLAPATALAKAPPAPFNATGTILGITAGNVSPIDALLPTGDSSTGKWLVQNRDVTIKLSGSANGIFVLDYSGTFVKATQAGTFTGAMKRGKGEMKFAVNGQTSGFNVLSHIFDENGNFIPTLCSLDMSGSWQGTEGIHASGTFAGTLTFVPTLDGHVDTIPTSSFTMTGTSSGHGD